MSDLRAGARKPRTRPALLGAWALAAAATAGSAFEGGPLPGFTGGFAEPTCAKCHFDQAPNDPAGSLRLSGLPRSYTPGARYVITILLQHPNLRRGGFQLAARFDSGPRRGTDAGVLRPLDERVSLVRSPDGRVHYAQHTAQGGKTAAASSASWQLEWTAPAGTDSVALHAAGNAANDDASPLGDFVYWLAETIPASRTAPTRLGLGARSAPFRP